MRKTILAVIMVVMLTTPCFAQEIKPDGLFSLGTTFWDCTCFNLLEEESDMLALPTVFKEVIAFYRGDFYTVFSHENGKCYLWGNHRSDVVIKWYDSDFGKDGFIPVVYFEFEQFYCEGFISLCWSVYWKGRVFPLYDVGFYKKWMDEEWNYDDRYCYMRKLNTRHFGECTICYDYPCY